MKKTTILVLLVASLSSPAFASVKCGEWVAVATVGACTLLGTWAGRSLDRRWDEYWAESRTRQLSNQPEVDPPDLSREFVLLYLAGSGAMLGGGYVLACRQDRRMEAATRSSVEFPH